MVKFALALLSSLAVLAGIALAAAADAPPGWCC